MLAQALYEEGEAFACPWNFGPEDGDARPVQWIVEYLCGQVPGASWQCEASPQLHEANILKLDSSKAKTKLGWQPQWNLQMALGMTLNWHQAWRQSDVMMLVSQAQIRSYEASQKSV